MDMILNDSQLTKFSQILMKTGADSLLTSTQTYTVWAPVDEALSSVEGYPVLLTRENNETAISNSERAVLANEAGADISIRIHANGSEDPQANGALALISSQSNPYTGSFYGESRALAESILALIAGGPVLQTRGSRKMIR